MNKFCLIIFCFLWVTLSCAKKESVKSEKNVVVESYRLIDEKRTDEAIQLLENALKDDEQNVDLKMALASAYAHKAGFRIQKLVPAVKQIEKLNKILKEEEKKKKEERNSVTGKKIDENASEIAFVLLKYTIFLETFASIPSPSQEESKILLHAISIINDLGNDIQPKHAIYRVVLSILLIKYYMTNGLVDDPEFALIKNKESCEIEVKNLSLYIRKLGELIVDVHYDLAIAHPNQSTDLRKNAESIARSLSVVAQQATNTVDINRMLLNVLNKELLGSFLQKYVQCE